MLKEIPGTCGFLASDDGKIYDQAFTERKQYKNKDGYSTATVLTDKGWITYGVLSLLANLSCLQSIIRTVINRTTLSVT